MKLRPMVCVVALIVFSLPLVAAEKPRIAVADFTNDTSAAWWYGGAGRDLSGMLTNELAATEKFRVVERKQLGKVLDEQDLAASGRVSAKSGAKTGKLTGAGYLVMGTVSSYSENRSGLGGGLSLKGFSVGGRKDDAYIAIDVRVVDTTTGDVEFTRTVEARSTSYGVRGSGHIGGLSGGLGKYENTPAGKAIRACLIEVSEYLSCVMVDQDGCMDDYKAADSARRQKTKKAIRPDR